MRSSKQSSFSIDAKEFLLDGNVSRLDLASIGAHLLLLCRARIEEVPGTLPNDTSLLANWARMTAGEWSDRWESVMFGFQLGSDGRWHNDRLKKEADHAKNISLARQKSILKRWARDAEVAEDTSVLQTKSNEDANVIRKKEKEERKVSPITPLKKEEKERTRAREEVARKIVQHYQAVVAPEQTTARGVKNVSKLLGSGVWVHDLTKAADAYAADCNRAGRECRYRMAVGNFYGRDATWEEYLQAPETTNYSSMAPEAIWTLMRGMSTEQRNSLAEKLNPELRDKVIEVRMKEQTAHAS